jgi:hypothetical protein
MNTDILGKPAMPIVALLREESGSFTMLVTFYHTTQHLFPEDSNLQFYLIASL